MKFKHIAAVLAGAAALSAPSCDLNEKFYSEVTPDTFFTSPESTYAVLCRPFTHWKWYIGADRWYLQELTTDEMTCPKRGADWYNGGEYYRLHYHTWSPDDRFVVNTYDGTTAAFRGLWRPKPIWKASITTPSGSATPSRPTTSTS